MLITKDSPAMSSRVYRYVHSRCQRAKLMPGCMPHDPTGTAVVSALLTLQAMSYATSLAHLTPVAGLWASSVPVFLYGVLGTSR